jgi:Tetratricopeptide repeat
MEASEEAESFYVRSPKIRRRHAHEDPSHLATGLSNLAVLFDNQRRFAEADPVYREALPLLTTALGPDHPHVAALMRKQAASLRWWRGASSVFGEWLFRLRTGRNRSAEADALEAAASKIDVNADL